MKLDTVTITGADDNNDPKDLVALWRRFPFVEWGILVGSTRAVNRFPSFGWTKRLVEARVKPDEQMRLSLHICGHALSSIALRGDNPFAKYMDLVMAFGRIQLNWHGESQESHAVANVFKALAETPEWNPEIIFQLDGVNDHLLELATQQFKYRCSGLFDRSHGGGIQPAEWPGCEQGVRYGWSGGLGAHNVATELPRIAAKARGPFWIDMETHVCSEDGRGLDLGLVEKVLEICAPWCHREEYVQH